MAQAANPALDLGSAEKGEPRAPSEDVAAGQSEDILGLQDLDVALNTKMHLVNDVSKTPGPWCPQACQRSDLLTRFPISRL